MNSQPISSSAVNNISNKNVEMKWNIRNAQKRKIGKPKVLEQ